MALKRDDLRGPFMEYLSNLTNNESWKYSSGENYDEVAAAKL